jgi:predicted protein tyrosine phosphatase
MNVLCLCSRNRLRSPTAEWVASQLDYVNADSAGLAADAEVVVNSEQIKLADIIVVMDKSHLKKLKTQFSKYLSNKRVICLDIPDNYQYMQPELIELLEKRMLPQLKRKK